MMYDMHVESARRRAVESDSRNPWALLGWSLLATALGILAVYWALGGAPWTGIDDANITLVYARNIALGHGYVYTPGFERVEGSTSLLWTLIAAGAFMLTDRAEALLFGLTWALTAIVVALIFRLQRVIFAEWPRRAVDATTSIYVIGLGAMFLWCAMTLMDVVLLLVLQLAIVDVVARRYHDRTSARSTAMSLTILVVLFTLTRPEAMALAPMLIMLAMIGDALRGKRAGIVLIHGAATVGWLVATSGQTIFRWVYFGVPFPNTFYAKVSSAPLDNAMDGARYLAKFVVQQPFAAVALSLAVIMTAFAIGRVCDAWKHDRDAAPRDLLMGFVAAICGFYLGLRLILGGDHFEFFRFLVPVMPLLSIFVVGAVMLVLRGQSGAIATIALRRAALVLGAGGAAAIYLFANLAGVAAAGGDFVRDFALAADGREVGRRLNALNERGIAPRVGVTTAGGIAYAYRGRVVDLLGLNWSAMAHATSRREGVRNHAAFAPEVFWNERPEIVLPRRSEAPNTGIQVSTFEDFVLKGLMRSPRFREEYQPASIGLGAERIVAFARRDWLATLVGKSQSVGLDWSVVTFR